MTFVAIHPILGIAVRSDGAVCVRNRYTRRFHWFYGSKDSSGYLVVKVNGKHRLVHRLTAETFIPNPENKPEVDHIDRNPANNRVGNLRWATRSENSRNTEQHDRVESRGGTHSYEDYKQFYKEKIANYSKTHNFVRFSDGKRRWVTNEQAAELLKLPVKERVMKRA